MAIIVGYDENNQPISFGSQQHYDLVKGWASYGEGVPEGFNLPSYMTEEGPNPDWWKGLQWAGTPWEQSSFEMQSWEELPDSFIPEGGPPPVAPQVPGFQVPDLKNPMYETSRIEDYVAKSGIEKIGSLMGPGFYQGPFAMKETSGLEGPMAQYQEYEGAYSNYLSDFEKWQQDFAKWEQETGGYNNMIQGSEPGQGTLVIQDFGPGSGMFGPEKKPDFFNDFLGGQKTPFQQQQDFFSKLSQYGSGLQVNQAGQFIEAGDYGTNQKLY